jgi:dTDP-4-amino-4,6-dideoxy-D-galactose acyltransferase
VIEFLKWDTDFFGKKIGLLKWDTQSVDNTESLISRSKDDGFDLLYIQCANTDFASNNIIRQTGAVCYDEKVIFRKNLNSKHHLIEGNIFSFPGFPLPEQLYSLAIQSGKFSRFNTDKKFEEGKFEELYKKWLDNSVNRSIADEVLVYSGNKSINGFVTLKLKDESGQIGLIAVDEKCRGQNIGSSLVKKIENILIEHDIFALSVVTQKANKPAYNFYLKNNFSVYEINNIYHLWLT